jgi:hypothetical protein
MKQSIKSLLGNRESARAKYIEGIQKLIVEEKPKDVVDFYLFRLSIVASHFADIMFSFEAEDRASKIGAFELFEAIQICVEQINALSQAEPDALWRSCWKLFCQCIAKLKKWSGDTKTNAKVAKIIFVTSGVIRQLRVPSQPLPPKGVEHSFSMFAESLGLKIDGAVSQNHNAEWTVKNLAWIIDSLG